MLKEKMKEFLIKLAMCMAAVGLAVGLGIFTVRSVFTKDDAKASEGEKPSLVSGAEDKKAPPVEVKGSVSDESEKKDAADKEKPKETAKKDELVTMEPKEAPEAPEMTEPENAPETSESEAAPETAQPEAALEAAEPEATLEPPSSESGGMTATLETQIQDMISSQYAAGGTIAVSAGHISDGFPVCVNNQSMQAASLIKLFVAGCIYETIDDPSPYESQISIMISASDNTACNSLVTMLGGGDAQAGMAAVNEYCMRNGFAETSMGRLMLQPNDQGDNYTSVQDCGNFLMRIYNGGLAGSAQILQYMKQQERRGKIPAGVPSGVETANKTGELDFVENDAAIIFHPSGAYILCVMSQDLSDAYTSRVFINSLSEKVYGLMG